MTNLFELLGGSRSAYTPWSTGELWADSSWEPHSQQTSINGWQRFWNTAHASMMVHEITAKHGVDGTWLIWLQPRTCGCRSRFAQLDWHDGISIDILQMGILIQIYRNRYINSFNNEMYPTRYIQRSKSNPPATKVPKRGILAASDTNGPICQSGTASAVGGFSTEPAAKKCMGLW